MRATPIWQLRGKLLRCYDCALLCRPSALPAGRPACPRCGAPALVIVSTGQALAGRFRVG